MNRLGFFTAAFLLIGISLFAQNQPKIVVLYPNAIKASDEIMEELKVFEKEIEVTDELRAKFVNSDLPIHWQINRRHLLEFLKEQDFFGLLTKATSDQLTYHFTDRQEEVVNFPVKDVSSADKNTYLQLADKYEVAWVANYTSMELIRESGKPTIKVYLQLYNSVSNVIWLSKEYIAHVNENCESSEWECALSDLVGQTSYDVYNMLEKKRDYWSTYSYEKTR